MTASNPIHPGLAVAQLMEARDGHYSTHVGDLTDQSLSLNDHLSLLMKFNNLLENRLHDDAEGDHDLSEHEALINLVKEIHRDFHEKNGSLSERLNGEINTAFSHANVGDLFGQDLSQISAREMRDAIDALKGIENRKSFEMSNLSGKLQQEMQLMLSVIEMLRRTLELVQKHQEHIKRNEAK